MLRGSARASHKPRSVPTYFLKEPNIQPLQRVLKLDDEGTRRPENPAHLVSERVFPATVPNKGTKFRHVIKSKVPSLNVNFAAFAWLRRADPFFCRARASIAKVPSTPIVTSATFQTTNSPRPVPQAMSAASRTHVGKSRSNIRRR